MKNRLGWMAGGFLVLAVPGGFAPEAGASGPALPLGQATAEQRVECTRIAKRGMKEWKTADRSEFEAPSPDRHRLSLELPVVFHVVNHKGGFFSMKSHAITESELDFHLRQARGIYRQCGIETVLKEVHFWDAPEFLDVLVRSENSPNELGWTQRCLMRPIHRDGMINIYFVEGVVNPHGIGRSIAVPQHWLRPVEPGDSRYVGAAFITSSDRTSAGERGVRDFVVSHEIGHILMDMSHVFRREFNIMNHNQELLSPVVTPDQCLRARRSPFVRKR